MISVGRLVRTEPLERLYRFPTSDLLARVYNLSWMLKQLYFFPKTNVRNSCHS